MRENNSVLPQGSLVHPWLEGDVKPLAESWMEMEIITVILSGLFERRNVEAATSQLQQVSTQKALLKFPP